MKCLYNNKTGCTFIHKKYASSVNNNISTEFDFGHLTTGQAWYSDRQCFSDLSEKQRKQWNVMPLIRLEEKQKLF